MRLYFIVFLVLTGCSMQAATCSSEIEAKKDIIGNQDNKITCNCKCPKGGSLVDAAGVVGGVLNLGDK